MFYEQIRVKIIRTHQESVCWDETFLPNKVNKLNRVNSQDTMKHYPQSLIKSRFQLINQCWGQKITSCPMCNINFMQIVLYHMTENGKEVIKSMTCCNVKVYVINSPFIDLLCFAACCLVPDVFFCYPMNYRLVQIFPMDLLHFCGKPKNMLI